MNSKQRKQLDSILETLTAHMKSAADQITDMLMDEENKFEELPEGLQYAPVGEALEESASNLSMAEEEINAAIDSIGEAIREAQQ